MADLNTSASGTRRRRTAVVSGRARMRPLRNVAGMPAIEATDGVQRAIRLIEGWNAAAPGSADESWEDLKAALNANRTSGRKLFPE